MIDPFKVTRTVGKEIIVIDGIKVTTCGIIHVVPFRRSPYEKDLQLFLQSLQKHNQGSVPRVFLAEIMEVSDPRARSDRFKKAMENIYLGTT